MEFPRQEYWSVLPGPSPGDLSDPGIEPDLPGGSMVKNLPANAGDSGDAGSIPWSRRCPGEGNGNPLQNSCLGNPMGRKAWGATACGAPKSWTEHTAHTSPALAGRFFTTEPPESPSLKMTPTANPALLQCSHYSLPKISLSDSCVVCESTNSADVSLGKSRKPLDNSVSYPIK